MYDKAVEEIKEIFLRQFPKDFLKRIRDSDINFMEIDKDLEQFLIRFEEESINYHKDTQ